MREKTDNRQHIQDSHWSKDKHARRKPDHPVVYAAFGPLADIVASSVDNPGELRVLDVGCGNGFLQWALEQRFGSVAGVDYSQQMVEINPCKETHLASSTNLPFADKSFDVAVAAHLLHHLIEPDRIRTLAEMKRVSRLTVVSFEPNRHNPVMFGFCLLKPEERMALRFTSSYMRGLFLEAGLEDIRVHVEGWVTPNKTPRWWPAVGRALGRTPLRRFGFDICTVARVK
jgi:SAM-dependent methyltransferase